MFSIAADERAAMQFEDLASALDAGLPLAAVGGDPAAGDRAVHAALRSRGVTLTATEDIVLLHAWRAGRVGAALRSRAHERTRRAEFVRTVWSGLRYPALLLVMVLVASAATAKIAGAGMLIGVAIAYVLLAAFAFAVRRAVRRGAEWPQRLPGLRGLVADFGELPYLETLGALYGAGVPLAGAHAQAVATVAVGGVAARLRLADRIVHSGRPLRDALAETMALHQETRTLLGNGEQSGTLEDAISRALARRRDVAGRNLVLMSKLVGRIAYGAAVVLCVVVIFRFYGSYLGALRR